MICVNSNVKNMKAAKVWKVCDIQLREGGTASRISWSIFRAEDRSGQGNGWGLGEGY